MTFDELIKIYGRAQNIGRRVDEYTARLNKISETFHDHHYDQSGLPVDAHAYT